MKKMLLLGVLLTGLAQAEVSFEVAQAFANDMAVQMEIQQLKQRLRNQLPGCMPRVVNEVDGHLFAARMNRSQFEDHHARVYLVSRNVVCTQDNNHMGTNVLRRSVTAKVRVRVARRPNGMIEEIPQRVVVVNITNDETDDYIIGFHN